MGWKIVGGQMVRVGPTPVEVTPPTPEIVVEVTHKSEPDDLTCEHCGKEYKTSQGLAKHIDAKH